MKIQNEAIELQETLEINVLKTASDILKGCILLLFDSNLMEIKELMV